MIKFIILLLKLTTLSKHGLLNNLIIFFCLADYFCKHDISRIFCEHQQSPINKLLEWLAYNVSFYMFFYTHFVPDLAEVLLMM